MKLNYTVTNNKYLNVKEVLKSHFKISDRLLTKLKKNQKIYLNHISTFVNAKLNLNDIIEVDLNFEELSNNIVPIKMNLDVIFEDETMLILNKSPNIPIHPSITGRFPPYWCRCPYCISGYNGKPLLLSDDSAPSAAAWRF